MFGKDSLRRIDGKLNGPDWKMGSHVKKKQMNGCEENDLEGQFVIPVKQMMQEDEDDDDAEECIGDTASRLTGNVRACYLNHLEKILVKNYKICCEIDNYEWVFSRDDVIKCAAWMEQKALRSCMVVILYQRAMTRLAADIKKHTEQHKLYRKLKDYVISDCGKYDKATQADERFGCADKTTQTDPITIVPEIQCATDTQEAAVEPQNFQIQSRTEVLQHSPTVKTFHPLAIKEEIFTPIKIQEEVVQGVPIPVYVTGMNSSVIRSVGSQYVPFVNGIEPISFDMNQDLMSSGNTDSLYQCPINDTTFTSNHNHNHNLTEVCISQQNLNEEEPYEWSVIEEQTKVNSKVNAITAEAPVRVRSLNSMQQDKHLSNGTLCENKLSDLHLEHPQMSIDERISSVLMKEGNLFSSDEHLQSDKTTPETDKETSVWTIEKCHQQELLHAKILETCMDVKKRGRMRLRFLELFGSDSEDSFNVDEHITNYKDKIARWVVDKLMPYYREGRILSRSLFKFLARHIADTLLMKDHMPGEADVERSVIEFFSNHDAIEKEDDVWL